MNKDKMRDIMEKHAKDYVDSLKRNNVDAEYIGQVRMILGDFFASKQVELYDDLIKSQHWKI